jgi:hypothetical protein
MGLVPLPRFQLCAYLVSPGLQGTFTVTPGWCWARQTLIEKRAPSRWQREFVSFSIGNETYVVLNTDYNPDNEAAIHLSGVFTPLAAWFEL